MRLRDSAILATLLLIATASVATAQRATLTRPLGGLHLGSIVLRDSALNRFAERLQLSDEQRGQMQDIAEGYRSANEDVLERMERMREELRTLRASPTRPTQDMFVEVMDRYDHPDLDVARAERRLAMRIRSILTPEQLKQVTSG